MFHKSLILIAFLLCIGLCIGSVSAVDETLTVVYCQDQNAYKFSVTNLDNGYVGITVRDSTGSYFRYYPGLENINPIQAKVALSGTPSEYTWDVVNQVDYIENTATARILTGYTGTPFDDIIEVKYQTTNSDVNGMILSSDLGTSSVIHEWWYNYYSSGKFGIYMRSSITSQAKDLYILPDLNIHTVIRNGVYVYLDGTYISFINNNAVPDILDCQYVFFNRVSGSQSYPFIGKLYYAKFSHNGSLVRDFIPIQISNGEYCLYDNCLTGNVIYRNQGTGTFTGGYEQIPLTYTHSLFKPDVSGISIVYSPLKPTAKQSQAITLNLTSAPIGKPEDEFYYTWYFNNTAISNATSIYEYIWNTNQQKGLYPISCKVTSPQYGLPAYINSTITFYEKEVPILISIEVFIVALFVLIVMFIFGMYIVNKMNVLGFVASGISALTMIVLTVLGAFGNVGNVAASVLYQRNETMGYSTVQYVTTYIDSSLVYISGFIALMMVIILLFVIGKYIATLTVLNKEEKEE